MTPDATLAILIFAFSGAALALCPILFFEEPDIAGPALFGAVLGVLLTLSTLTLFG